jgi:hypothetical protein
MRRLTATLLALCCVTASGCFTIEQTMTFDRNLSGTAGVTMAVDMEALVGVAASLKHSMREQPGKPSEADIAAARKDILASLSKRKPIDFEKDRKAVESQLPAGVRLISANFKEEGLKLSAEVLLGFDHPAKLEQISLAGKSGEKAPGPATDNPMESPFDGLKIIDEGRTLLVTSPARNPVAEQQEEVSALPMDPELKALLDSILGGVRVAVRLTAPFEVVEHNAHRKEGNTLVWDYNYASLQKMTLAEVEQGIRVRYRK